MNKKDVNKRISLALDAAETSPQVEADLAARKIRFLLPDECEMVNGAALQFAYDSPTMYV